MVSSKKPMMKITNTVKRIIDENDDTNFGFIEETIDENHQHSKVNHIWKWWKLILVSPKKPLMKIDYETNRKSITKVTILKGMKPNYDTNRNLIMKPLMKAILCKIGDETKICETKNHRLNMHVDFQPSQKNNETTKNSKTKLGFDLPFGDCLTVFLRFFFIFSSFFFSCFFTIFWFTSKSKWKT